MSSHENVELDPLNTTEATPNCEDEPMSSGDARRWKWFSLTATVAALAVAMTMLVIGFHVRPLSAGPTTAEEFINKDSLPRCVECYTDQCSLDYKTWSSCPQSHPYYSDMHGACVSSEKACYEGNPVKRSFGKSLCADCFAKNCFVGHTVKKCSARAPYYIPTTDFCVDSCSAPPGPPPPLFNCDSADYHNFERAWSDQKKQWCCDYKSKGCHKDEICPAPSRRACESDTGETCNWFDCGEHQGSCKKEKLGWFTQHKCVCDEGHCLHQTKRGTCMEVGCCFHMRGQKCESTSITSKEVCIESLGELMTNYPDITGSWSKECPSSVAEGMKMLST